MDSRNKTKINEDIVEQIPFLRAQGLPFRKIAAQLDIGETTVRKYQHFKSQNKYPLSHYKFTARQVQIAILAAENLERKATVK
jgi:DNA invertase Pin-like site-specific DNA recombinase